MSAALALADGAAIGGGPLVRRAVAAVTDHIRREGLRVGDSLPGEGWFAAELGVSRAVMREAFGALAALRLIDVGNGRKPRVAPMDGAAISASLDHAVSTAQVTVPEIWEVRRTLEVRTAALAAVHRTAAEAAGLTALAQRMATDRHDLNAVTLHDIAFHRLIATAGRNALYAQIVSSFGPLMRIAVPAAWRTRGSEDERERVLEIHAAIAFAIHAGDPGGAAGAMAAHFDRDIGEVLAADASAA